MPRVAIIGGSFGGLTAAFELKRMLGSRAEVTVISDTDRFIFVPSLPWVAMGWRRARDISLPLEGILKPKGISFMHAEAKGVDPGASKVLTSAGDVRYDYLVIATGPELAFGEVPGFSPGSGGIECIFTLDQAERAHKAWGRFIESPGPVVIGSVQGVSCFGPAYEYAFEIDSELRKLGIRHKVPMHFVTSEPYIGHFGIGGFGASRRWLEDEFAERDIKPLAGQAVQEFAPGEARLKDSTRIPFKLAMFAPAMKGVQAVAHLGNPRGFIPVDENLRHRTHGNILSVGVAVAIAPPEPTPVPTGVPKTGYMSVRMGKAAALTIASEVMGKAPASPYEMDVVCIMDMGGNAAYMSARPLLPPRQEITLKKALWAKWMKAWFERYFLFKMRHGLTGLP